MKKITLADIFDLLILVVALLLVSIGKAESAFLMIIALELAKLRILFEKYIKLTSN